MEQVFSTINDLGLHFGFEKRFINERLNSGWSILEALEIIPRTYRF